MLKQLHFSVIGLIATAVALPAMAAFHLMKVVEIFPGTPASPNAQYVVIQMYASGQNVVNGHAITVFNAADTQVGTFTFGGNVANGASQDKILIATTQAASFFSLTPDLTMSAAMISGGGKVCFDSIDCVAWGSFSGSSAGVGTPYQIAQGLSSGRAAIRRLDIGGSASLLDASDDTDNCANDFIEGLPAPRNNLRVSGTIPAATCGNGVIEGLEQCDDSNTLNGDGCSSTCRVEPPPPALSVADVSVAEGNSGTKLVNFTVSLSATAASPVTFDISTEPGTGTPGVDFASRSLTGQAIAAGQSTFNFAVTVNGDTEVEDNESFTVNLNNPAGAVLLDGQAKGTISNDDVAVLSIADATEAEGNSSTTGMVFVVSLSKPQSTAVSFNIATSDGTAIAGSDYVARSQIGRTIDAGRSSARFEVAINGDTIAEPNESLNATLSSVTGATLGDAFATGTIVNDEPAAQVSISAIQGNSLSSPLLGAAVQAEGVVTALTVDGFYIQSSPGKDDGDRQTSEGVFVSGNSAGIQVGDLVRAGGRVDEFFAGGDAQLLGVTRIISDRISILGQGQPLPQPVLLDSQDAGPANAVSALEKYEGMRVRVGPIRVVAPSGSGLPQMSARIGSDQLFQAVMEGVARPFLEPGLEHAARYVGMSDGSPIVFDGNPERLAVDPAGQRGATPLAVDGGDIVAGVRGVLDYHSTSYRILVDADGAPSVLAGANPKPVSVPTKSESTIGSVQLDPLIKRPTSSRADPARQAEYVRQIGKTADVICGYLHRPDIIAVFGATGVETLSDLAAALNGKARVAIPSASCRGGDDYRVHALRAAPDRAYIVSSRLARPGIQKVEVLSVSRPDIGGVLGGVRAGPESAPTLLSVRFHDDGGVALAATIMASRFARMEGAGLKHGAPAQLRNISRARALRMSQARALAKLLQQRQDENVVVVGDFDAPAFSDGFANLLEVVSDQPGERRQVVDFSDGLVGPRMTNLSTRLPADDRYTEVRDGNAQLRSHILVNAAMLSTSSRMHVEPARVNADFAADNRDDPMVPLQSGQVDPMVLYFQLR